MSKKINPIKAGALALGLIVAGAGIFSSFGYNDSGVSTRVQQPLVGHKWVKEEGYYGKIPFLSRTKSYNQVGTVAGSDNQSIIESASLTVPPRALQFADSYQMKVEWAMRYQIPTDDEGLEKMHKALKSENNLLGNTVMPFAQTLVNDSVNQMLGGDFAQGGRNSLRTLIDDQSQNGMYQTKVERVKTGRSNGKGSNTTTGGTNNEGLEVTKVIYLKDKDGKPERTPLAISQYGIKIVPNSISIIEAEAQGRLIDYIDTKQANIKKQIAQDEAQKLLTKEAQTAKLKGERDLVTRTNALNIAKEEAIIKKEQEVAEARLQAEKETVEREKVAQLAIIDKKRELQIAKDNEGIQQANAAAAKYEAQAIKEKGFAEVAVEEARLKAKNENQEIYLAEIQRDISKIMYPALRGVEITMPQMYQVSGEGADAKPMNSLDVFTTLSSLEKLKDNK